MSKIGIVSLDGVRSAAGLVNTGKNMSLDVVGLSLASLEFDLHSSTPKLYLSGELIDSFSIIYVRYPGKYLHELSLLLRYCMDVGIRVVDAGLYATLSYTASKADTTEKLVKAGLPLPRQSILARALWENYTWKGDYPIVAKPVDGVKGRYVQKISNEAELHQYLSKTASAVVIQEMIPSEGDYRLFVVGDKVLGAMWRKPNSRGQFMAKLSEGGSRQSVKLPKKVIELAKNAANACGWEICGVDLIRNIKTDKWLILEANRNPVYKSFSQVTGVDVEKIIIEYLQQNAKNYSQLKI